MDTNTIMREFMRVFKRDRPIRSIVSTRRLASSSFASFRVVFFITLFPSLYPLISLFSTPSSLFSLRNTARPLRGRSDFKLRV